MPQSEELLYSFTNKDSVLQSHYQSRPHPSINTDETERDAEVNPHITVQQVFNNDGNVIQ